jgi:hypothetical protein
MKRKSNFHQSSEVQNVKINMHSAEALAVSLERLLRAHDADVASGDLVASGNGNAAEQARTALQAIGIEVRPISQDEWLRASSSQSAWDTVYTAMQQVTPRHF